MTKAPDSLVGWALDFHSQTERLTRRAQFREHVGLDNRDLYREICTRQRDLQRFFAAIQEEGPTDG